MGNDLPAQRAKVQKVLHTKMAYVKKLCDKKLKEIGLKTVTILRR